MKNNLVMAAAVLALILSGLACAVTVDLGEGTETGPSNPQQGVTPQFGEQATVVWVIDGDTIDVEIDGQEYRIRYIGIDTPERDEVCYDEATDANAALVEGKVVTLVADVEDTDRYDRLLRYVYVDGQFVNEHLIREGWAEVLSIEPNTTWERHFETLADQARSFGLGCYPTGVFDD